MKARPPQGNAIIIGEFPPDIGESGTARYFSLELRDGDVYLDELTMFQEQAANGALRRCIIEAAKATVPPPRIHEEVLDAAVWEYASAVYEWTRRK